MNLEVWHVWVLAGICLFIAEMFTSGFFLACIGIACFVAACVAGAKFGFDWQLGAFSLSALLAFFAIRPVFLRFLDTSGPGMRTNVDALVGKVGVVSAKIGPGTKDGRVQLEGDDWRGRSVDNTSINEGDSVEVVKVEGTKLFVRPVSRM